MRPSRVLKETRRGEVATVAKINISNPHVIELCGLAGFSAVWICNEHIPTDWSMIEHCVRAAKIHDMDVIVRVAKGSYSDYIKPFECDASGIMVPHVTSADEAKKVVDMCRFHPIGHRAVDGGNADGNYCQHEPADYIRFSNEEKFIILQIESPEGVAQADAIASVPGFEFLLFGPGDYSQQIGQYGKTHLPEVQEARRKVEEATAAHGKKGFAVGVPGPADNLLPRGYVLTCLGADVLILGSGFKSLVENFRGGTVPSARTYGQGSP
jgi:4-hydroxy-2-oxoheptanedioate aldolase